MTASTAQSVRACARARALRCLAALALATLPAACGDPDPPLPGLREEVRGGVGPTVIAAAVDVAAEAAPPLALPPQRTLADWPQRVGNAVNDPAHASLSATPTRIWSTDIGRGDTRRQRIVADPVADGARIYALDARSGVSAVAVDGTPVWRRSLVPATDRATDASGGGLGVAGGTLFVATGFGALHALEAATGRTLWVQELDAPLTTPKPVGDRVYVVSRDARAWSIDAVTGRIDWEVPAAPSVAVSAMSPAPAVTERLAIFPFGAGDIVAVERADGRRVWNAGISGARRGVAYNAVGDVTGDPVVAGGRLYAGTTSGRTVAVDVETGARLWTVTEGAVSPAVVVGGSVVVVTDRAQLVRLDAETGATLWVTDLPFHVARRLRRRAAVHAHYGPILAGGRLWVASSDGLVRGFDPTTGTLAATLSVPGGAAARPIALRDALFVVSRRGVLHAFR